MQDERQHLHRIGILRCNLEDLTENCFTFAKLPSAQMLNGQIQCLLGRKLLHRKSAHCRSSKVILRCMKVYEECVIADAGKVATSRTAQHSGQRWGLPRMS